MNLPLFIVYKIMDYLDNYTKYKFTIAYKSSISYFHNIRVLDLYISNVDLIYIIPFMDNIEILNISIDSNNIRYLDGVFNRIKCKQLTSLKIRISNNISEYILLNKHIKKIIKNHINISNLYIYNCASLTNLTLEYIKNICLHLTNIEINNCKCVSNDIFTIMTNQSTNRLN